MFQSYLNYEEYLELGGNVSEDEFAILVRKAQRMLDYFTFDRCKCLTVIPEEVKEVLTEYVDKLKSYNSQEKDGDLITKYSNGVETLQYRRKSNSEITKEMGRLAFQWLPDYLVNRGVKFDVEQYLQTESNNS